MFRRSRFSVRPNVSSLGRACGAATAVTTTAASQESPSASTEVSDTPNEASDNNPAVVVTEEKSDVPPSEKVAASGSNQNGEGSASSAAVQRRKRFSVKPRVTPGRPAPLPRLPKSPVKAAPESPAEVSISSLDKSPPNASRQTGSTASVQGLLSPRRQSPSEGCKPLRFQSRPAVISSESIINESPVKTSPSADKSKQAETPSGSHIKDPPPVRGPDKIPLSLPDREAAEISEKARTLVTSKTTLSLTPSAYSLSRLLNSPSDLQRLVKAQKLRELLKEEKRKEKTRKREKTRAKEYSLDPSKMTMSDLIHYLPTSNPMLTCLEDSSQENETVLPASPEPQKPTEEVKQPEVAPKSLSDGDPEEEDEEEEVEEDVLMVPQVKVAEDGTLIIDEESLTVEVQRTKGPNIVADRDPIFERGSTTTYSSFRKGSYTKPWSSEETDMFFLAVSMVGTDFTMICQLFPHRARSEIKNKFKKEERENSWRVDKAFKERRQLDIEYFSKLLEKIMDYQKNKKKLKSLEKANAPKKRRKKAKASGKKSAKRLSDVEEEDDEEEEEVLPDFEEEVEKENEDVCNEGGASKRKKKIKKLTEEEAEEPSLKKIKKAESKGEDGVLPHDAEEALPEEHTTTDICEKPIEDSISKGTLIKPAQLSRGRAPKPLLHLRSKYAMKPPKVDGNGSDAVPILQEDKETSPYGKAKVSEAVSDGTSSEEEEIVVKPPKPTRYGRLPKQTKPLIIEDSHSSASETQLTSQVGSPPSAANTKTSAKKRISTKPQPSKASKKPKLITLTASQSDFSDEEGEDGSKDEELALEQQQLAYSSDSVFVPASLHTPQPVIPEVDETMAEFDILASMPDVLDISHDALCPDSSCAQAQQETGSAEPFEHQLDLLVDVIDYLSSEPTEEVSEDQSYNEAAKTLLTIGNVDQTSQSEEGQTDLQDRSPLISSASDKEEMNTHSAAPEEHSLDMFPAFDHKLTELSTTASLLEPATTNTTDMVILNTIDQIGELQEAPTPTLQSVLESPSKGSPQTKKQRMPKLKPKPNIGRSSRAPQLKPNSEESSVESVSLPIDKDTGPKTLDMFKETLKEDFSGTQTLLKKTPPDSEERLVHEIDLSATKSDQVSSELSKQSFSEPYCEPEKDVSSGNKSVMSCSKNDNIASLVEGVQIRNIAEREIEKKSIQKTNIVLESSSNKDAMSPSRENLLVSQNEVKEAATLSQSKEDQIKPKPSRPQISGGGNYESQTPERPVDNVSAPVHVQAGNEPSPVLSTSLEDATVIQKEVETALIPQPRRSRLQKPKPNLPHISRPLRSKPGTTKICEEHNMRTEESFGDTASTSDFSNETQKDHVQTESSGFSMVTMDLADSGSNLGSAQLLEGQDISTSRVSSVDHLLIHQNEGEVDVAGQLKKSGLQKPKPIGPQKAENSRSEPEAEVESAERDVIAEDSIGGTGTTSQFTDELTSSVSTEGSFTNVDNSIVTEPPVGQKSENYCNQVQADQDNVLTTLVEHLPVSQKLVEPSSTHLPRKIGLQKPNLSQKSRTSQSIPGTTAEPEEKDLTTKESLGDRDPTLDYRNKNLSTCAQTDSSCGVLEKTDSAGTGPPVKQGWNVDLDSFQMQEGQSHSASSISCVEELQAIQKEGEVTSTCQQKRSRLQKPKPNLPQSLRTLRSKHEIAKLPVEKDLIPKEETKNTEPPSTLMDENLTSPSETESGFSDVAKRDSLVSELQVGQCLNKDSAQVQTNQVSNPETTQEEFTDETDTSPVKTINVTRTESAVKEVLSEQKLNVELAEVPLGEGHCLTMPATNAEASQAQSERALTSQPIRGRFLKPKPNLPLISRRSKSEKKLNPLSNSECEVTEPTLAVHSEHQHSYLTSGPPSDLHSTPAHSKEMTATAERKTSPKLTEQMVLVAVPPEQSVPGKIQLNECQVEPVPVQAPIDIISKISDENQLTCVSTTESNSEHVTTDLSCTQVGHGLHADAVQVQEDDYRPDLPATSVEVFPVIQEREKVVSLSQSRKSRLQRIKPKPNLSQARPTLSKPGPLKDTLSQHVEETPNKSFESDFQPETSMTQPEAQSSVEDTTGASSTYKHAEESFLIDEEKAKAESTVLLPTTSEQTKLLSGDLSNTPDDSHLDANSRSMSEKHLSRDCNESRRDHDLLEKDRKAFAQVDSLSKDKSMDLEECASSDGMHIAICEVPDNESLPTDMFSKSIHNAECTLNETSLEAGSSSKPNAQQSSDPIPTSTDNSSSLPLERVLSGKSTDNVSPVPTDSSVTSDEALHASTVRLSPPKPRIEDSTSPIQVQQEQETTPAQTDFVVPLQGLDLNDHKTESDNRSNIQDPVALGGVAPVTQHSLALMSVVSSAQVASPAGADSVQSCQRFSDFLPDQVPSDPDEPFFILSLTAIPGQTSTETDPSEAGQVLDQPVTVALVQEQSVSEELSVTGGGESVPNKPSSPEKSDSKSDTYQTVSLVVAEVSQETPTSVGHSLKSPAHEDNNEVPSATEKRPCTRSRAKPQTKPTTAQRQQRSKGSTEETPSANTGRKTRKGSKNAGPSEPKTPESHELRSGDVDLDQESVTSEEDLNSNLGTKTTKHVRGQRQKRKPKDKPASTKSPPPPKALSKGSKARAVREKSRVPEPATSSSHDIRSTTQGKKTAVPSQMEADLEVTSGRTDHNTSVCTAEVSASQENVCVMDSSPDEEPITVSQYFFGDIFTEVEEK
ncbi:transcription factor TFIIIB component B'' homolog isoform X2 [Gouania willdenowi]|uniref:transcription factor TFIIIB component B'' homolog isoform X2 n=1 Tax=Gouania willdenowi TaxID=441366 RepID=UPI001055DBFE|nr:transcription factor TFIIIB component B'' homolog isoform X2 [Gouania willdenowi]